MLKFKWQEQISWEELYELIMLLIKEKQVVAVDSAAEEEDLAAVEEVVEEAEEVVEEAEEVVEEAEEVGTEGVVALAKDVAVVVADLLKKAALLNSKATKSLLTSVLNKLVISEARLYGRVPPFLVPTFLG
jgi:hypothetical protein